MRHRINNQAFGRKQGPKKALIRGLVVSLVEHERIKTTLTKAKALRGYVEKAVTAGKKGSVHAHRILLSKYPNKDTVQKIVKDLAVRFKDRKGGYTRVIKIGDRPGDKADMAFIEFVDYKLPEASNEESTVVDKEVQKVEKLQAKRRMDKKKAVRKIQNESRRRNRK